MNDNFAPAKAKFMKTFVKSLVVLVGCITAFTIYVQFTYLQQFEAPTTGITASSDSSIIARGEYLVTGPSHCYYCHMPDSMRKAGLKSPMIGGNAIKTPFATFYIPNITPDKETGIGKFTDEQLARAIRYNISHNDNAMVGFMPYNAMSDSDIQAIISYLRTTEPVKHEVSRHDYNLLGKVLMRFMVRPRFVESENTLPDTTIEYGKYLAMNVANCYACHTKRDKLGRYIGDSHAGGNEWAYDDATYTAPNLTPHDTAGRIKPWTEEIFIQRFKMGRVLQNSPMPWEGYQILTDNDLKALYRYLNSLPPSRNRVDETYVLRKASK